MNSPNIPFCSVACVLLQEMAGGRSDHAFMNWGLSQSCKPELYFEPTCEDDLRQVDLSQKPLLQPFIRLERHGARCETAYGEIKSSAAAEKAARQRRISLHLSKWPI